METESTPPTLGKNEIGPSFETAPDEEFGLPAQSHRLARIRQYEEAALRRSDPYAALIGFQNADIARILEHLGTAVVERLDGQVHTLDEFRELERPIRLMIKMKEVLAIDLALDDRTDEYPPSEAQNARKPKKGISLRPKSHVRGQTLDGQW